MPVAKVTLTFRDPFINDTKGFMILNNRLFRNKKKFESAVFYPEVGDNSLFHFHGIIRYLPENKLALQSFLGNWKRYVGFYKISDKDNKFANKNPNHLLEWMMYCQKDQWLWKHRRVELYKTKRYKYDITCKKCNCIKKPIIQQSVLEWFQREGEEGQKELMLFDHYKQKSEREFSISHKDL